MIGDNLTILDCHTKAARSIANALGAEIKNKKGHYMIAIAGESGSGKSAIAAELARILAEQSISSYIFQQDDYCFFPPKTNESMRRKDINHVGTSEVNIKLLNEHLCAILQGAGAIKKPLVDFEDDSIGEEEITLTQIKVLIAEGTYATLLDHIDCRIFIDMTYLDTKKGRLERSREKQDCFLEKVLEIEHRLISRHKKKAHIIVTGTFDTILQDAT